MRSVYEVAASPNPFKANREKLANNTYELAFYQVLMLDKQEEDPSDLLSKPGISGELKPRILEVHEHLDMLQEFMHGIEGPVNYNTVWDAVLFRYRQCFAWTHVHHAVRYGLDDYNNAKDKDWFWPSVCASCAWHEGVIRSKLNMPDVLDDSVLLYSKFGELVHEGVRYPDLEWKRYMERFQKSLAAKKELVNCLVSFHMTTNYERKRMALLRRRKL